MARYLLHNKLDRNWVSRDGRVAHAFMKGGAPTCPGGGTYTYDVVGTDPSCSLSASGHVLAGDFDSTD